MRYALAWLPALALVVFCPDVATAQTTHTVTTEAELRTALTSSLDGDTIRLAANITLSGDLPPIAVPLTFDGDGYTLSGGGQYRGLVVYNDSLVTPFPVTIANLTIADTVATGGAGGDGSLGGGGGGGGLGGALHVSPRADVTISNITIVDSAAVGGAGGEPVGPGAGGGGGMGGAGGTPTSVGGGGGGGFGASATGGDVGMDGGAGLATNLSGGGGGADALGGFGGDAGGGGGGGDVAGGGGGIGGSFGNAVNGGGSGYGGGGGGAASVPFAFGGFGGIGGGGGGGTDGGGGSAYGGGGGGSTTGTGTTDNINGGGGAGLDGGGGGAGLGGAIFVVEGATLTIGGNVNIAGNSVVGGRGGGNAEDGSAAGSGIWLAGAGTLGVSAAAGETITIADEIADSRGTGILEYDSSLEEQTTRPWVVQKDGEGRLVLSADNRYAGGTNIVAGTLSVARDSNLGTTDPSLIESASVRIGDQATLEITESGTFARPMSVYGDASVSVLAGRSVTWTGDVLDNDLGSLHVTGGGTLELQGVGTYQLGTRVTGDSTLRVSADASLGSFGTPVTLGDATTHGTLAFTGDGTILSARSVQLDIGGGTIDVQGTTEVELVSTGGVTGSGDFHKTGTGLLSLGNATHNGGTFIDGGTLRMNLANAFLPTSAVAVASGATFDLDDNDQSIGSLAGAGTVELGSATLDTGADNADTVFSGTIAGVGQLIKRGTGSFTLTGANSYTGGTSLISGELRVHAGSLPGDILNNGSLVFDQVDTGTYSGAISGSGSLVKLGAGALTLAGTATHSGGTAILEGTLIGTTTNLTGSISNAAALVFDQASSGTYAGALSGPGQLVKRGTGTVTFASAQPFFTGATLVEGGTLALGTNQVFAPTNAVAINSGAILDLTGTTQAFGALGGNGTVAIGTGALTLGQGNVSSIFSGQLTGNGSLIKTGTGALALTGSSAFTGVTTVAAGSLIGTSASLGPTIVNNATLVFDQTGTGTYTGSISGNGVLVKTGDGTLRLAGSATHTGGTQILGGTLAGDSSTLTGTFLNQATIQFDQNGSGTFAGTIVGSGRLVKDGGGTLVLAGPNGYTGGTFVNAGTLVGNTSSLVGDIANNAAVVFEQASNGTYAGSMQGGGSLTKTGGGILALTGTNTHTGGTFVEGGTLVGSTSSLTGTITNNARVVFDQDTDGAFTGRMTGSGVFEKAGAGTLTVDGQLEHTGGTLVSGGTLLGNAASLRGLFLNEGTLAFGGATDGTFQGSLFGAGGLLKVGSHTLTLVGEQPFSGTTTVREGTLVLDGLLGGDVVVEPGGTFRGTGAIAGSLNLGGALVLDDDGVSAPASTASLWPASVPFRQMLAEATGTSPILTVGRDLTSTPGASLTMGVGAGGTPSLLVDGSAQLDKLALTIDTPGLGDQRSVSFLALGARNGLAFNDATIQTTNDRVLPHLTRRNNALLVTLVNLDAPLDRGLTDPLLGGVGNALGGFGRNPTGDRGTVLTEVLALDDQGYRDALRQIAGEVHASSRVLGVRSTEAFTDMIRDNLLARDIEGDSETGGPSTGWGGEFVRWWGRFSTERTSYSPSTGALSGEALLQDAGYGFDLRLSDQWLIGAGGGFGVGSLALDGFGSRSESHTPRGFGTVGWKPKNFKGIGIRMGGSVARMTSDSQRHLLIVAMLPDELGGGPLTGGIDRRPTSEEVTTLMDQWTEVSDRFTVKGYRFDVLVGLRRHTFSRDAFTEVGAGALSLHAIAETLTLKDADVKVHTLRRRGSWRPFGEVLVRRSSDWPTWTRMTLSGAEPGQVQEFEVRGLPLGTNAVAGRLGLMAVRRIGTFTAEYRFRKASGQLSQAFDLRFRF